jgi:hypothetical protein
VGWYVGYSNWGTFLAVYSFDGVTAPGMQQLVGGPYPDINQCQIAIDGFINQS